MHGTSISEKKFYPRRSRSKPKATTGRVGITDNDISGFFEPLSRYGLLPTNHLVEFDKRYDRTRHKRLTKFFQETEKWKPKDKPILRYIDSEHWSINSQVKYARGPAAYKFLGISPKVQRLHESSIIGPLPDPHDIELAIHVARIELAIKKAGLRYYSHIDVLKDEAARVAFDADKPLHIPIPGGIRWNMTGGPVQTPATSYAPDALFGIEYPTAIRFFAVEHDRGSETEIPKYDLKRRSWLRKVLCLQAVSKGILQEYLGIPKLYCLVIAKSEDRRQGILKAIRHVYSEGTEYIAVAVNEPIPVFKTIPPPNDHLFTSDWLRVGHPPLNLTRI